MEKYAKTYDVPDNRDFNANDLFHVPPGSGTIDLRNDVPAHNQGNVGACTAVALTHVFEILNTIEQKQLITFDWREQWDEQKANGATDERGDSLQNALKVLIDNGLLNIEIDLYKADSYAKVDIDNIAGFLHLGFPIYTAVDVTLTNFKKAKTTGYWGGLDGDKVTGHAIAIIGINKDGDYICLNSWGNTWGKFNDGSFLVKKEDIQYTYSKYILYDHKDIKHEVIFKDVTDISLEYEAIKWSRDMGLFKGTGTEEAFEKRMFHPDRPISRREMAIVLQRFYNLIK
jgi:hypothetical protein